MQDSGEGGRGDGQTEMGRQTAEVWADGDGGTDGEEQTGRDGQTDGGEMDRWNGWTY